MVKTNLLIFLTLLLAIKSNCQRKEMDLTEYLINSTIKIQVIDSIVKKGQKNVMYGGSGTGFFFTFDVKKRQVPTIITNKHVVKSAIEATFIFSEQDTSGNPIYGKTQKVTLQVKDLKIIYHPDTSVDLAIIFVNPILTKFESQKIILGYHSLEEGNIPNDSVLRTLSAFEELYMIGYPFGLKDEINNLPIVRRGITATPLYINYNGKKEFLADIPVFGGSSGSPIIVYQNMFSDGDRLAFGRRFFLVGINYATYTREFKGKVIPKTTYNFTDSVDVQTFIPYNIGIIIKSQRILEFKKELEKMVTTRR
jgi:hypothetical protein